MIMTREQFIATSGVQVQTLEFWIEQEWLIPDQTPSGPTFTEVEVARARLIQDLTSDLGVNDEGVDVILHLMDQIHGLRRALLEVHDSM
jgi:chaperone modulatory protein CbpM